MESYGALSDLNNGLYGGKPTPPKKTAFQKMSSNGRR